MIKIIVGNRNSGKTSHLLNLNHVDSGILSKKMIEDEVTYGYDALLIKDQMKKETPFVRRIEDDIYLQNDKLWMKFNERYTYNEDVYRHVDLIANDFIQKAVSEQFAEKPFFVLDEISDFTAKRRLGFYKTLVKLVKYHRYYRLCLTTTKNNLKDLSQIIEEILGKTMEECKNDITIDYLHDVACVLVDSNKMDNHQDKINRISKILKKVLSARCFSKKVFVSNDNAMVTQIKEIFGTSITCIYCDNASQSKLYKKGLLESMGIRPSGCMLLSVDSIDLECLNFNLMVRQFKNVHQKKNPCDLESILRFEVEEISKEMTIFSNAYYRQILKLNDTQTYDTVVYNYQDKVIHINI